MERSKNPKYLCLCLLLLLLGGSGFAQTAGAHELVLENGLWVEQFDSTNREANRFTANNVLYKEGRSFTYRYFYIDQQGQKYLQKIVPKAHRDREKAWKLVPLPEKDSLTHDRLQIIIASDLEGVKAGTTGFNHTPIRYEYFAPAGQLHFLEHKSLVENERNIWMQPPTARLFRILALNPFPFIQAPFAVGHSWQWQQIIPAYWGDSRWKEWQGSVLNNYQYRISKEEKLITAFGVLECLVVEAEAISSLGSTSLLAYFHPGYGFVKLLYTNIDGSKILLELLKLEE